MLVHKMYVCTYTCTYSNTFSSLSYCTHEEEIGKMAEELGFTHVSLSSKVMPMVKMISRGYTGILCCCEPLLYG